MSIINTNDTINKEVLLSAYKQLKDKQVSTFKFQQQINEYAFDKLHLTDRIIQILDSRHQIENAEANRTCQCDQINQQDRYISAFNSITSAQSTSENDIVNFYKNVLGLNKNKVADCNLVKGNVTPQCSIQPFHVSDYYYELEVIQELDGSYSQITNGDGYYVFYSEDGNITINGRTFKELVEIRTNEAIQVTSDKSMFAYRFSILSEDTEDKSVGFTVNPGSYEIYIEQYSDFDIEQTFADRDFVLKSKQQSNGLYIYTARILTLKQDQLYIRHKQEDMFANIFFSVRWRQIG